MNEMLRDEVEVKGKWFTGNVAAMVCGATATGELHAELRESEVDQR